LKRFSPEHEAPTLNMMLRRLSLLVLLPALAAFAMALLAAIVLAVADIYVTGHGGESLMRTWITWGDAVRLSRADLIFYAAAIVGGVAGFLAGLQSLRVTKRPAG
jgi:hypothetical protein